MFLFPDLKRLSLVVTVALLGFSKGGPDALGVIPPVPSSLFQFPYHPMSQVPLVSLSTQNILSNVSFPSLALLLCLCTLSIGLQARSYHSSVPYTTHSILQRLHSHILSSQFPSPSSRKLGVSQPSWEQDNEVCLFLAAIVTELYIQTVHIKAKQYWLLLMQQSYQVLAKGAWVMS